MDEKRILWKIVGLSRGDLLCEAPAREVCKSDWVRSRHRSRNRAAPRGYAAAAAQASRRSILGHRLCKVQKRGNQEIAYRSRFLR